MTRKAKPSQLTEREDRFVDAYGESANATHAARVAGYTGSDHVLGVTGSRLLKKARVASAIAERALKRKRASVASRERRLEVLSQQVEGELIAPLGIAGGKVVYGPPSHADRTRAALAIARMNGELLPTEPARVDVNVQAQSLHVVVMLPQSKLGPPPPHALIAEAPASPVPDPEGTDRG